MSKLIYFLIAIVPMMIYPFTVDGQQVGIAKIRELSIFSLAIIICSLLQKNIWLRLFLAWCVINWWLNIFPLVSYVGLSNILCFLIIGTVTLYLLENKVIKTDTILKIISYSVVAQLVWFIFMHNSKYNWVGNSGALGILIAMTAFLLLTSKFTKPLFFIVLIASLLLIRNFTMALCFAAGGLFYVSRKKAFPYIAGGTILALGIFAMIKSPNFDRFPIWIRAIQSNTKPIIGNGINTFSLLGIRDATNTPWTTLHNEPIQIYYELGLIGLVLFLGFIISKVIHYIHLKSDKQIAMLSCLIAFLVACLFWSPMHSPHMSFYAIIIFSCLEYSIKEESYLKEKI